MVDSASSPEEFTKVRVSMSSYSLKRFAMVAVFGTVLLMALEQEAAAQTVLLAQSSGAKTAIGYGLVLLCLILGLLVVLRPSKRKLKEKQKQQPAARK